jgi:hypothetical protein
MSSASSQQGHPVVDLVVRGLSGTPQDGYTLTAQWMDGVRRALVALRHEVHLRPAVRALVRLAQVLEMQRGSGKLARALVRMMAEVVRGLVSQGVNLGTLGDELSVAASRFRRFTGGVAQARAPVAAPGSPVGTVRAGSLCPVRVR